MRTLKSLAGASVLALILSLPAHGQVIIGGGGSGGVTSFSGDTTGLTPATPTTGAIVLGGTLTPTNGGTGINSLGTGVAAALGANVSGTGAICLASGSACGGGAGTVTSITAGTGISLSTDPCTATCTASTLITLNNQTGTTYALASTDGGKIVLGNNASSQAYSIVQANTAGFTSGYGTTVSNIGAGTITITAATSVFGNGLTTLAVAPGQVADIGSNSTDYPFTAMSLPKMAQDTVLGNPAAANYPVAMTVPSCANDGAHGLVYASHAFACASITGGSATPGGSDTQIQFNNAGSFGGISTLTNVSGAITNSKAGAASTPAMTFSGAPFTGGSGTTTFPLFYLNSGTAPTTFSTAGTVIGVNAPSGFTGNLIDLMTNGTSFFHVSGVGLAAIVGFDVVGGSSGVTNGMQLVTANHPGVYASSTKIVDFSSASGGVWNKGQLDINAAGYALTTGASSATNANIRPNQASNSGIGAQASGNWSGIANSVERFRVTAEGVQYKQATAPVPTGTGTPTIATGSTDEAGEVTSGASATSVIITFNLTHANAPFCVVTPQSTLVSFAYTLSNTAITITQTATSSEKIDYRCTFP